MELQRLYERKAQLENEFKNQEITQKDYDEIASKVSAYEDDLLNARKEFYTHNKDLLEAQIRLIEDMIDEEQKPDVFENGERIQYNKL